MTQEYLNAHGGRELLELESQTHLDAHGGRKLFETRELREKHVHESRRVESGDDAPICVTKEGGASGRKGRGSFTPPNTHYARAQSVGVDTVPPPAHPMTRPPARQPI